MNKRGRKILLYNSVVFQIILLIGMSFYISFIFSKYVGIGSADGGITGVNFDNMGRVVLNPPVTGAAPTAPPAAAGGLESTVPPPAMGGSGITSVPPGFEAGIWDNNVWRADVSGGAFKNLKTGEITFNGEVLQKGNTEATTAGGKGIFDIVKDIYGGNALGGKTIGALVGGAAWGFTVYGIVKTLTSLFGLDKPLADSLSAAAGLGVGAGVTASYLVSHGVINTAGSVGANPTIWGMTPGAFGALVGIGVGVAVFLMTYKKEETRVISFECLPWEPPLGGDKCDMCNKPGLPCTEYRCKSLGQGCEIINQGTDKEMCFWKNRGDTQAPKINPNEGAFKPLGLVFRPDTAISPPNTGFKIINPKATNGCIEAFTKLEFGITTSELAQCRIDYAKTDKYENMAYLFGESNYFEFNHTQRLKIPDQTNASQSPEIFTKRNGVNTVTLYTRCIDGNGNGGNSAEVAFSFCVKPGPDTSPPIVEAGSIDSGSFIQFNADKVPYELYVNEPSECKWSRLDKSFKDMENTMNCPNQVNQINANLDYVCTAELTGIKNDADNKFYFRCKDLPGKIDKDRNVMSTSFPLILKGTKNQLVIEQVGPNGTITGGESVIGVNLRVKTAFGVEDGKAVCGYSLVENDLANYIDMDETNNYLHNQTQFLPQGNYQYFFKCVDKGGNLANASTSFIVKTDVAEPLIARIFRDGPSMKIITNEDAECVYSLNSCSYEFSSGTAFNYDTLSSGGFNKKVHLTDWDISKVYYIKCQDLNGKRPRPDKCSVTIQGSEL